MEYLVTMTTHVPDGTSEGAVQDIRTREATRSSELAAQGYLLRLWRPPLHPGEWRTLGLFAAHDGVELDEVLTSMPLRVWRTDAVTPLSPHPNDPVREAGTPGPGSSEFLTTFSEAVSAATASDTVDGIAQCPGDRAWELAGPGYLERLWTLPGPGLTMGLWEALDSVRMNAILASLPFSPGTRVETTPLTRHPSDPALTRG